MNQAEIALPPYAQAIGVSLHSWDGNTPILGVDYSDVICGNPGTFHGGAIGGILEMAAVAALEADLGSRGQAARLTQVSSTVEYLRAAGESRTFASARIIKSGRRFANMQASLWQDSPDKLVATSLVNILIEAGASEPK